MGFLLSKVFGLEKGARFFFYIYENCFLPSRSSITFTFLFILALFHKSKYIISIIYVFDFA